VLNDREIRHSVILSQAGCALFDGRISISDFGLGRIFDSRSSRKTLSGQQLGTLGYIAPEQLRDGKAADIRSDIFSLGRLMYELYSGDSPGAIQDLALVPVGAAMIIERCTKTDPGARFQSVSELQSAFQSMITTRGQKSDEEKIRELLGQAVTRGDLDPTEIKKLGKLLGRALSDADLVHDALIGLPVAVIQGLWSVNPVVTKALVKLFSDHVMGQSWAFNYTDKIANALIRIHNAVTDHEMRAMATCAMIEVGVSHNRYYVMEQARELLREKRKPEEVRQIAYALRKYKDQLGVLAESLNIAKLDPELRDLFRLS